MEPGLNRENQTNTSILPCKLLQVDKFLQGNLEIGLGLGWFYRSESRSDCGLRAVVQINVCGQGPGPVVVWVWNRSLDSGTRRILWSVRVLC